MSRTVEVKDCKGKVIHTYEIISEEEKKEMEKKKNYKPK